MEQFEQEILHFLTLKPVPFQHLSISLCRFDLFNKHMDHKYEKCTELLNKHVYPTYSFFLQGVTPKWTLLKKGRFKFTFDLYWKYPNTYAIPGLIMTDLENKAGKEYRAMIAKQYNLSEEETYEQFLSGKIKDYRSIMILF